MNLAEQLKEAQGKIGALEQSVQGLTAARDEAAQKCKGFEEQLSGMSGQLEAAQKAVAAAEEQAQKAQAALDKAGGALKTAESERDVLKATLALSGGHKDLSGGTLDGKPGTQGGGAASNDEQFLKAYQAASPAEKPKLWRERMKGGFARLNVMLVLALAGLLVACGVCSVQAADRAFGQVILETANASTGTVATVVSDKLVGAVESITVIVPTGVTCDVAVASSDLTLLLKADATGTAVYLPRFTIHDASGAVNTNTTHAVDKAVVVDTVTASFDECSDTNQTVKVLINYAR